MSEGTPARRRRRPSDIASLKISEENKTIVGQVVSMEDVKKYEAPDTVRNIVLANAQANTKFVHMSCWNESRNNFAEMTNTVFLDSSYTSNSTRFKSLLGKTLILKGISVVNPPKEMYNIGNADYAIAFKGCSSVEIETEEALLITGQEESYYSFLANTHFVCDEFKALIPNVSGESTIDIEVIIGSVGDIRFRCYDGVLNTVVDIKCKYGDKKDIVLCAWNAMAWFIREFATKNMGRHVCLKGVKTKDGKLTFQYNSKLYVVPRPKFFPKMNSLKDMTKIEGGEVEATFRLLFESDFISSTSSYGNYVSNASDGVHMCQVYNTGKPSFGEDDEILLKNVVVSWHGDVLAISLLDVGEIIDQDKCEINKDIKFDELHYPEK